MPRLVRCALIQTSLPDATGGPLEIKEATIRPETIREVRDGWQFFRDRRPEMYGEMGQQLP